MPLDIKKLDAGYVIWHPLTGMDVTPALKHKRTATRYIKYLLAGGLQWAMTEKPRNPQDKDIPEVVRFIKLRDARRRLCRELEPDELEQLL